MTMTRRPTRTIGFIGLQATNTIGWYNQQVGGSMLQYARLGRGRRMHILDTTPIEVP